MKLIDLSHPISHGMPTYPSDPDISIIKEKEIDADLSLLHSFKLGTHTGTHLDVPAHIIFDGKTLNDFPIDTFSGIAIKVDNQSYIDLNKIKEKIDDTGWYNYYNDPDKFYGSKRPIIPMPLLNYAVNKGIKFFGCDLPSVDTSGSKDKHVHHDLLGADIIVYESLTNLDQLPVLTLFEFYGFPLPLVGLDGSPVRAVGILQ